MSFCIKCGTELKEKDLFCTNCGAKIEKQTSIQNITTNEENPIKIEHFKKNNSFLRKFQNNHLKKFVLCISIIIICCSIWYFSKDFFYFQYYTYISNKSTSSTDKLLYSDKALSYKTNETSINNYKNAIEQDINDINAVTTSLQNNKNKLSKDTYNNLMIDAFKVQLKKYVATNDNENAFKTFIALNKYGYNYKNDDNYKNIILNICNSITNNNIKSIADLNENGIVFGDIDNDGVDEILQVTNLNSDPFNPTSYITAYKFDGQKFTKIDSAEVDGMIILSKIFIGKPNKEITALFINSVVGVHSGASNAYFLKDNKLIPLMSQSISSIYPVNPKDIDNDGFIEFGDMEVDPNSVDQSYAGSDKIIAWFKSDANGETTEAKKEYDKN